MEFFKLQEGGKEAQGAPYNSSSCKGGSWNFSQGSGYCDRRGTDPRGWARTGLEPETLVYLNFVPFDVILDVGSNISTVDVTVYEYLKIPIRPFVCDFILNSGIEGALMTKTHVAVMGWIEVEVGILGLGCILAIFWVTDCSYDRCVPVVLGSHQIKKVYAQARVKNIKYWPAPWKDLYEWNAVNKWHGYGCNEDLNDLYDSDDYEEDDYCIGNLFEGSQSKQVAKSSSLSSADSWLELAMEEESEESVMERAEAQIASSSSTALKGVPPRIAEAYQESPVVGAPQEEEPCPIGNGDDPHVFEPLAPKSELVVGDPDSLCKCNSTGVAEHTVQLVPNSTVSCRITPTGEAFLHFQWSPSK